MEFLTWANVIYCITCTSSWKQVNGGVPQGTKLGLTLFAVMINKLLRNWHMRSKYVDDTIASEIIPRNSISILDLVVREIHDYWIEHKMKLNSKKMQRNVYKFYDEFGYFIATYMCWI